MTKTCMHCQKPVVGRHLSCVMCKQCSQEHYRRRCVASSILYRAVKSGKVQAARIHKCADCDSPASRYDHRDYSQPLHVAPVCAACNSKRGPASWGRPVLDVTKAEAA